MGFLTEQAMSYCTEEEEKVGGETTEGLWNGVSNVLGPSEGNSCSNNFASFTCGVLLASDFEGVLI